MTIVFFFSSRRRHTRDWRDWSSDVCSSDLTIASGWRKSTQRKPRAVSSSYSRLRSLFVPIPKATGEVGRSEERRVGKECRGRGPPEHSDPPKRRTGRGAATVGQWTTGDVGV